MSKYRSGCECVMENTKEGDREKQREGEMREIDLVFKNNLGDICISVMHISKAK